MISESALSSIQKCFVFKQCTDCFHPTLPMKEWAIVRWIRLRISRMENALDKVWRKTDDQPTHANYSKYKWTNGRIGLDILFGILLILSVVLCAWGRHLHTSLWGTVLLIPLAFMVLSLSIVLSYVCHPSDSRWAIYFERGLMGIVHALPFLMCLVVILLLLLPYTIAKSFDQSLFLGDLIASAVYMICAVFMVWILGLGTNYWLSPPCISLKYLGVLAQFVYMSLLIAACIPLAYVLSHQQVDDSFTFFAGAILGAALSLVVDFYRNSASPTQSVANAMDDLCLQLSIAPLDAATLSNAAMNLDKALNAKILPTILSKSRFAPPELRFTIMAYINQLLAGKETINGGTPLTSYMSIHFSSRQVSSSGKARLMEAIRADTSDEVIRENLMEFLNVVRKYLVLL